MRCQSWRGKGEGWQKIKSFIPFFMHLSSQFCRDEKEALSNAPKTDMLNALF